MAVGLDASTNATSSRATSFSLMPCGKGNLSNDNASLPTTGFYLSHPERRCRCPFARRLFIFAYSGDFAGASLTAILCHLRPLRATSFPTTSDIAAHVQRAEQCASRPMPFQGRDLSWPPLPCSPPSESRPANRPIGVVTVEHFARDRDPHELPEQLPDLLHFLQHAGGALDNVILSSAEPTGPSARPCWTARRWDPRRAAY